MDEFAATMERIRETDGAGVLGGTGEAIGFQQQEAYARRFLHALGSPNYFSAESLCFAFRYIAHLPDAWLLQTPSPISRTPKPL